MSFATLVIGLGGTGVQTLRALKRLWRELPSEERVPASFLGIDLDRSALEAGDVRSELDELREDEFLYLDPRAVQESLRHLDRSHGEQPAWANVLEWFPERVKIPVSDVEANGASQLRVLGRLAFFLNDEAISRALRRKLHELGGEVDPLRLSEEKRVILVSSIAGGTGAGMLIDIAYLARRQMGRPRVFAYLLLPEVFLDVDGGGRILQNSYACIQELCHLKDQQIPIKANYFHLPPLDVPVHGEEPFARLFLCASEGFCGTDPIRAATARLAESILGQLQRTIQNSTLAVVANTVSADALDEQSRRRTHCFSTVGSQYISLMPVEQLDEAVFDSTLRAIRQPTFLAQIYGEDVSAAARQIAEILGGVAESNPLPTGAPEEVANRDERNLVRSWRGRIERDARQSREQLCANLVDQLKLIDETLRALRPEDVEPTRRRLANLGELIVEDFTDKTYERKLQLLRELTSERPKEGAPGVDRKTLFDKLDQRLREEVRALVTTAERTLGEQPIARKAFFEKLLGDAALFYYSIPEGSSAEIRATRERREKWARVAAGQVGSGWWRRLVPKRVSAVIVGRRMVGDLREALADPGFAAHLEAILRVRAIKELRAALEQRLEEAESNLPGAAVWGEIPGGELGTTPKIDQLPPALRQRVLVLLRAKLSSLVEDARQFATEPDAEERRKGLLELVQARLREDRELGRNHQVLEWGQRDVENRLREALVRVRQRVFERRTPNLLREGFALVMVPEGLVWPRGDRQDLFRFLHASASQILDSRVQVIPYRGSRIWIYAEDLFNPPDHIRNLDDYSHAYQASEFVELYHIDRRFLRNPQFRDIRTRTSTYVATCGNEPSPGESPCGFNIATLAAEIHTCPGCGKPIRSRCGNPDCPERELQRDPRRHDKSCPACGRFNHAAWWCCQRHGEIPEEISIDKEQCPRCIEEHQRDPIAYPAAKVSKRPDLRDRQECPSCVDLRRKDRRHRVFHLPPELLCFYRDGVNGHERARFEQLADRHGLPDRVRCPSCRTLLIPVHHRSGKPCPDEEIPCPTY